MTVVQFFEMVMLVCFGVSWPISVVKTVRTKDPKGKSLIFIGLVIVGYIAGIFYKLFGTTDFVIFFYITNATMATCDLILCNYYLRRNKRSQIK